MMPERILADVRAELPDDAYLTTDVGWNKNGVGQQFPIRTPGTVLTPGGFATMGFGPSAAIGAKLAAPTAPSCRWSATAASAEPGDARHRRRARSGDRVGGHEQQRLRHHRRPPEGALRADLRHDLPRRRRGPAPVPDYAAVARAYGATGIRHRRRGRLPPALAKAIAMDGPVVLDVPMKNNPTPTTGHWNILDIYAPDEARRSAAYLATE